MSEAIQDIKEGVVLAELGGYGDGPYCATHAANAALAMMGTYIVDPGLCGSMQKALAYRKTL